MKTFIIFVLLSVWFAFSNKLINATGFEDLLRLRRKSATLNEGGIFFKKMKNKTQECFICKEKFTSNRKTNYCSTKCRMAGNRIYSRNYKKKLSNKTKSTYNYIKSICKICKKEFLKMRNQYCCSELCSYKARLKQQREHPAKRTDNRSRNNIITPNSFLEILFSYFDYECKVCYKKTNNLCIHHLTPLSKGGRNHINNVISICYECHRMAHSTLSNQTNYIMSSYYKM